MKEKQFFIDINEFSRPPTLYFAYGPWDNRVMRTLRPFFAFVGHRIGLTRMHQIFISSSIVIALVYGLTGPIRTPILQVFNTGSSFCVFWYWKNKYRKLHEYLGNIDPANARACLGELLDNRVRSQIADISRMRWIYTWTMVMIFPCYFVNPFYGWWTISGWISQILLLLAAFSATVFVPKRPAKERQMALPGLSRLIPATVRSES